MPFRTQGLTNVQIQRRDVVPMTRTYIAEAEARLRRAEKKKAQKFQLAGE